MNNYSWVEVGGWASPDINYNPNCCSTAVEPDFNTIYVVQSIGL